MTGMIKSYIALLCVLLLLAPAGGFAADPPQSNGPAPGSQADMAAKANIEHLQSSGEVAPAKSRKGQ